MTADRSAGRRPYRTALVASEVPLLHGPDGRYRPALASITYEDFARFLEVAEQVTVVARVEPDDGSQQATPIDGPSVDVRPLPRYRGLRELVGVLPQLSGTFLRMGHRDALFVGRVPETITFMLFAASRFRRADFFTFFVADPLLVLPLPGRWTRVKKALVRHMLAHSLAVVYVTREWLQERYPPPAGTPTMARSNVRLTEEAFREVPTGEWPSPVRLLNIGTMGSLAKGQDLLIRVVAALRSKGRDVSLALVGDGPYQEKLRQLADELAVAEAVRFEGATTSAIANRKLLDRSDLFVFGSRAEGLPRAVIEAMARGLPVVSTRAGGVGELLDPDLVVEIDDVTAFTAAVERLIDDPVFRAGQARRNLAVAREIQVSTSPQRFAAFLTEAVRLRRRAVRPGSRGVRLFAR